MSSAAQREFYSTASTGAQAASAGMFRSANLSIISDAAVSVSVLFFLGKMSRLLSLILGGGLSLARLILNLRIRLTKTAGRKGSFYQATA